MLIKQNIDQYYVIGYPVKHSLSPQIHTEFAEKTEQSMRYEALEICPDNLEQTLIVLRMDPTVKGLSVTVPFKERLYAYCDQLDELAEEAQAVSNVIINDKREFIGLNLDGLGLVNDIRSNLKTSLKGKRILVFGAGGAAKGILGALLRECPERITVANRTLIKAEALVDYFKFATAQLLAQGLDDITGVYDIVINATSASISNESLPLKLSYFAKKALAYDLMYAPDGTAFTQWCSTHGINAIDGKGMLMELSKMAFKRWRGVLPE